MITTTFLPPGAVLITSKSSTNVPASGVGVFHGWDA
jgi:hypothetical protein